MLIIFVLQRLNRYCLYTHKKKWVSNQGETLHQSTNQK
jgi:hypothetical protein